MKKVETKEISYPPLLFSLASLVHLTSCTVDVCLRHLDTHHCNYEQYYVFVVQKAFCSQLCLDVGHSVTRSNFTVHNIICTLLQAYLFWLYVKNVLSVLWMSFMNIMWRGVGGKCNSVMNRVVVTDPSLWVTIQGDVCLRARHENHQTCVHEGKS